MVRIHTSAPRQPRIIPGLRRFRRRHLSRALTAATSVPPCSRSGACCHGATVRITPWELLRLAEGSSQDARAFRELHTSGGGTILRRHAACTLYAPDRGCRVHPVRPLACRLFPLARRRVDTVAIYDWAEADGSCHRLCPETRGTPHLTVAEYLASQDVAAAEAAHDGYATALAGLLASAGWIATHAPEAADLPGPPDTATPDDIAALLPPDCLDLLTLPTCTATSADPAAFVDEHRRLLAAAVAAGFGGRSPRAVLAIILQLAWLLAPVLGTPLDEVRRRYRAAIA